MKITISPEAERWFEWRSKERAKHRVMTSAEYFAWCRSGDVLSSPSDANAFPGGITIDFSDNGILGKTADAPTSNW